jgi:iron(III)-salmochelin esterase
LIALHGLGEAQKGREPGSWGWIRDYKLDQAMMALRQGSLTAAHFQGFVEGKRLARINRSLKKRPFRGVVVACPYTPDLITKKSLDNAEPFAALLHDRMMPRIRKETGVLPAAASTGLDGVSLGARLALLVGLARKDAFGAIGSMQTAIQGEEVKELSRRVADAWHDGGPHLRLLTSDKDFYREAVLALHLALKAAQFKHEYLMIPGPHAYAFNRGPGSIEMLLWHDRVLRGEPGM